jgi:quercetin dioxygenase-like cupin family protein
MKHAVPTDALQEQAALYALGALGTDESRQFEVHLAEGCATCEGELRAFGQVVVDLGHAVAPVTPRPAARERLLARVGARAPVPGAVVVRASDAGWEAGAVPGVTARPLHHDPATRRMTALVRMAPGAGYPAHAHADTEELFLLSGELHVGDIRLRTGDYCAGVPGSRHVASVSPAGCTFVIHASEDDRLGEDAPGSTEGILVVHAGDGAWQPGPAEGVRYRVLQEDAERSTRTSLVRMAPGAVIPAHHHHVAEQVYFLEGDGRVAGEELGPGDYYRVPAGTVHEPSTTRQGCTFLVIASRNEVLA